MSRHIRARTEKFCEYCGRVETRNPDKTRFHRNEIHLRAQPDGTMTCRQCGKEHNHKHQTPKPQPQTNIKPMWMQAQDRIQPDNIMTLPDDTIERILDQFGV